MGFACSKFDEIEWHFVQILYCEVGGIRDYADGQYVSQDCRLIHPRLVVGMAIINRTKFTCYIQSKAMAAKKL